MMCKLYNSIIDFCLLVLSCTELNNWPMSSRISVHLIKDSFIQKAAAVHHASPTFNCRCLCHHLYCSRLYFNLTFLENMFVKMKFFMQMLPLQSYWLWVVTGPQLMQKLSIWTVTKTQLVQSQVITPSIWALDSTVWLVLLLDFSLCSATASASASSMTLILTFGLGK